MDPTGPIRSSERFAAPRRTDHLDTPPDKGIIKRQRTHEQPYKAAETVEITRPTESLSVNPMSGELRNELHNALNAIIGFSEVLVGEVFGPLNERQFRYVNNILTSGRHLLQLIHDVPDPVKSDLRE